MQYLYQVISQKKNTLDNKGIQNVDYDNSDLNKLGDDELAAHKKKMDEVFFKNFKDPKSKEFVYEIEVSHNNKLLAKL